MAALPIWSFVFVWNNFENIQTTLFRPLLNRYLYFIGLILFARASPIYYFHCFSTTNIHSSTCCKFKSLNSFFLLKNQIHNIFITAIRRCNDIAIVMLYCWQRTEHYRILKRFCTSSSSTKFLAVLPCCFVLLFSRGLCERQYFPRSKCRNEGVGKTCSY